MNPLFAPPLPNRRIWRLTRRNFLVWRKLMLSSVVAHLADPVIFLLGFGLGVGALVGEVGGGSYLQFIAAGMVCYGTMNGASFESLYSAFTRMHVQRTWEGILNAPMTLDDVLLGEWLWAAIKGLMAGAAMLLVLTLLGLAPPLAAPLLLPFLFLASLAFSGLGLMVNAIARSYEFFSYYFTLFITPMMMLSGAFFPVSVLPDALRTLSHLLPLTHIVSIARPLLAGETPTLPLLHIGVLAFYAVAGVYVAAVLTRRRLLK